ncbi:THUMP domain containing 2 [Mactra antiquata]
MTTSTNKGLMKATAIVNSRMEFYCTAGRGTQSFVSMELKETFSENVQVKSTDGKTYFTIQNTENDLYNKLMSLKSVERIFVQCVLENFDKLDRRGLLTLLHKKLGDVVSWKKCMDTLYKVEQNLTGDEVKQTDSDTEYEPARKRTKWTFRVNCRFSGFAKKQLDNKKTSKQMGVLISKTLGWRTDLKNPRYEINIHLSDDTLSVGIPLYNKPLSERTYIKYCRLRTPIAWIMIKLLHIQYSDVILDPMCGCATILIEAAHCFKRSSYIGIDKDMSQLKLASENIDFASQHSVDISLIHGDARNISLLDNSVNHIITDAPFGQNHKVPGDLQSFYVDVLMEMYRVLQPGGRIVILTSPKLCEFLKTILKLSSELCHEGDINNSCRNDADNSDSQLKSMSHNDLDHVCDNSSVACHKQLTMLEMLYVYNVKLGETDGCICVIHKLYNHG